MLDRVGQLFGNYRPTGCATRCQYRVNWLYRLLHRYLQFADGFLDIVPRQNRGKSQEAGPEPFQSHVHLVAQPVGKKKTLC